MRRIKVPKCAACGKPLRKARYALTHEGLNSTGINNQRWLSDKAEKLGVELPRAVAFTSDEQPPTRGDYGCNLVCGQRCGHALAVRIVLAVPGVLDLLPESWRKRP